MTYSEALVHYIVSELQKDGYDIEPAIINFFAGPSKLTSIHFGMIFDLNMSIKISKGIEEQCRIATQIINNIYDHMDPKECHYYENCYSTKSNSKD